MVRAGPAHAAQARSTRPLDHPRTQQRAPDLNICCRRTAFLSTSRTWLPVLQLLTCLELDLALWHTVCCLSFVSCISVSMLHFDPADTEEHPDTRHKALVLLPEALLNEFATRGGAPSTGRGGAEPPSPRRHRARPFWGTVLSHGRRSRRGRACRPPSFPPPGTDAIEPSLNKHIYEAMLL